MSETLMEKRVVDWAEAHGWHVRKLVWLGQSGAPDRIFIRQGIVVFIELKDRAKEPSALQARQHRDLRAHGANVYWADTFEKAVAQLKAHM